MESETELKQILDKISVAAETISKSLNAIAAMQLAEEFYTKAERADFYIKKAQLEEQADQARDALHEKKWSGDYLSWEQFEREESPEVVTEARAQLTAKMKRVSEASRALEELEADHPVLAQLHRHSKRIVR